MIIFAIKYAWKSIQRRPKKNMGAVLAIALGVMLLIGVQVGSTGLEKSLAKDWYQSVGEVDFFVTNPAQGLFDANLTTHIEHNIDYSKIESISTRIESHIPLYANEDGQFENAVQSIALHPGDVNDFGGWFDLNGNVIDPDVLTTTSVVVNDILAAQMDLTVGETISSSFSDLNGSTFPMELTVAAIINNNVGLGLENNFGGEAIAYLNIDTLQSGFHENKQNYVSKIAYKVSGVLRSLDNLDYRGQSYPNKQVVDGLVDSVQVVVEEIDVTFQAYSMRSEVAENVEREIDNIEGTLNLFVFMLTATALLLIINVQTMALDDRRYQTAVLRAMGSSKLQIFSVFLIEAIIVGVAGAVLGTIFGIFYGQYFIQGTINAIFGFTPTNAMAVTSAMVSSAVTMGIFLAIITTVVPAWYAASRSITNELRGIEEEKVSGRGYRTLVFGIVSTSLGLLFAQNVGAFWTKEAWSAFDDVVNIMLGLGLTIFGTGLILSYIINRKLALNMSALGFYGLALFSLFVAIDWVESGNGNNWLTVNLFFIVVGLVMLVVVNFEFLMAGLNWLLSRLSGARAISQVSTKAMIGKKNRLSMVFAIFTIVLILTVFISSASHSIATSNVDAYETRANGVDIVINANVPHPGITQTIQDVDGVSQVYGFRSYFGPILLDHPLISENYDPSDDLTFRRIVEVPYEVINPSGDWSDEESLPLSFFGASSEYGYEFQTNMDADTRLELSSTILDDFYNLGEIEVDVTSDDITDLSQERSESAVMVLGDFFLFGIQHLYLQSMDPNDPIIEAYVPAAAFSMMGDWDMLSGSILVTPDIAEQLPGFAGSNSPNIFLVKTTATYGSEANIEIAQAIESSINDLADPESLSGEAGILIGATSRVVESEVAFFWERESSVWDFLATFSTLGLILAAMGMIIIAVRSVAERTREIGMMRAIGFDRSSVVLTVAIELLFITFLGLLLGVLNGMLITETFATSAMETVARYPWQQIIGYVVGVLGISVFAGIIPGIRASRVPPSQALRYTG